MTTFTSMISVLLQLTLVSAFTASGLHETCTSPKVSSETFIAQDVETTKSAAYIIEFNVTCSFGNVSNIYAETERSIKLVPSTGRNSYQLSWIEEFSTIRRSGERVIRIFDANEYVAIERAGRVSEIGDATLELFKLSVNVPERVKRRWLKCESVAAMISGIIGCAALYLKSKLVS